MFVVSVFSVLLVVCILSMCILLMYVAFGGLYSAFVDMMWSVSKRELVVAFINGTIFIFRIVFAVTSVFHFLGIQIHCLAA